MVLCEDRQADCGLDVARGLVHGLLFAIPLWVVLGIVPVLVFQDGSIGESTSLALMIAAVCEMILARPYLRTLWTRLLAHKTFELRFPAHGAGTRTRGNRSQPPGRQGKLRDDRDKPAGQRFNSIEDLLRHVESNAAPAPRPRHVPRPRRVHAATSLIRQSLALSALAGAYLQYYFLEVNLQIASLNALTVFLPVTSMT